VKKNLIDNFNYFHICCCSASTKLENNSSCEEEQSNILMMKAVLTRKIIVFLYYIFSIIIMTNISVFLDNDLIEWLDQLVQAGVIKNRSEAIRGGIHTFIKQKLKILSAKDLRNFLQSQAKKPFKNGIGVIREIREEGS